MMLFGDCYCCLLGLQSEVLTLPPSGPILRCCGGKLILLLLSFSADRVLFPLIALPFIDHELKAAGIGEDDYCIFNN